jgi:membrane fusion protein, multidrug efflux system
MSVSAQVGTGARFSLLPFENATCSYVKAVERAPFKIALTEPPTAPHRIGPGIFVEPEVHVQ